MPTSSGNNIHQHIRAYYDSQASRFGKHFEASLDSCTVDAIHDLRVAVKRMRALTQLMEWVDGAFSPKTEKKSIRRLYKAAGRIRDLHVMQELTRSYTIRHTLEVSEYYNHLIEEEDKYRSKYKAKSADFDVNVLIALRERITESLSRSEEHVTEFRTRQRLSNQVNKLLEYRSLSGFETDDLHGIRKLSKEARYTLEVLQKSTENDSGLKNLNSLLRDCHRALGRWHDADVGRIRLSAFLRENVNRALFRPNDYISFSKALEADQARYLKDFEVAWTKLSDHVNNSSMALLS